MSPEQMFEPEMTDERSDLFSLAVVAYFALTRRTPFEADSIEGLYVAIEGASFRKPSALRPELSPAIDAWFERALARKPEDRFQTAPELARAFREALVARRVEPKAPAEITDAATVLPKLHHRRWKSKVVLAGVLAAMATVVIGWLRDGGALGRWVVGPTALPERAEIPRPAFDESAP